MVDYGFLKNSNGKKRGRVEFLDVDLPASDGGPSELGKQLTTTELVRQKIKAGKKGLENMRKEADDFECKTESDFYRGVEMVGQCKKLEKQLTDSVNGAIKHLWDEWKEGKNILSVFTDEIKKVQAIPQGKIDAYAHQAEMKRRSDAQKAADEAARLQAKIDAEQASLDAQEKEAAKKEGREPVYLPPITVDKPVIPQEIKTKTESGSAKIEMVLEHTITDITSPFLHKLILDYCGPAYKTIADQACKKAIKAGAIGLKGASGITVEEKAKTKHRRR
jgi:hypothetical protein